MEEIILTVIARAHDETLILTLNDPYTSNADTMMSAHRQQVTIVRKSESSVGNGRRENSKGTKKLGQVSEIWILGCDEELKRGLEAHETIFFCKTFEFNKLELSSLDQDGVLKSNTQCQLSSWGRRTRLFGGFHLPLKKCKAKKNRSVYCTIS